MKKFLKTGVAAVLLAASVVCAACSGGNSNMVKGMPDYSADEKVKEFMIGGYCAPHSGIFNNGVDDDYVTEEAYKQMREAGLDYILTLYDVYNPDNPTQILKHLNYAAKAGVKVLVRWDGIVGMGSATAAEMEKALAPIKDHPAFWGIFAKDEPSASWFNDLGKACEVYKQVCPDKYYYVNLFPNYANTEQLGADSYRKYVNLYCYKVNNGMIIEDHYPFGHVQGSDKYSVNTAYLSNLEVIQKYAKYYKREHWEYIQGETCGNGSKTPDYYDMRFQIYTSMCYGVINMQYFCYFSPFAGMKGETAAFIDCEGKPTDIYYGGQKINAEIHKFDHVYLNYVNNYVGVMTKIGSKNEKGTQPAFEGLSETISSHERIASFDAEQDAIIGAYKDGDGRDGFMVCNYTVPAYRIKNKISLKFNDCDGVIYYREGEYNFVEAKKGVFEIELDAGEGIFVIPVKR